MKLFNVIIFVKSKKELRLRRFKSRGGTKNLFNLLNNKQMSERTKIRLCDYVVVNEKNLMILKKNLLSIISKYE
jgi:dephospho-CoA kinase